MPSMSISISNRYDVAAVSSRAVETSSFASGVGDAVGVPVTTGVDSPPDTQPTSAKTLTNASRIEDVRMDPPSKNGGTLPDVEEWRAYGDVKLESGVTSAGSGSVTSTFPS